MVEEQTQKKNYGYIHSNNFSLVKSKALYMHLNQIFWKSGFFKANKNIHFGYKDTRLSTMFIFFKKKSSQ